jgi:hypothetical protein
MIKIFIGTSPNEKDKKAEQALEYSLKKHSSQPLEIHWMRDSNGWNTSRWSTPFSGLRWCVPHMCDFKGRAIFLDVDMLNFKDINELYTTDMQGKYILARKIGSKFLNSVMLFDCENIKNVMPTIQELKQDPYVNDRNGLILKLHNYFGSIDSRWNVLDYEDINNFWFLHYTSMQYQPWKPSWYKGKHENHPNGKIKDLWHSIYKEALLSL